MTKRHVLIVGGDADGNLGDRAILQSMCQALRERDPTLGITIVSSRPCETMPLQGIEVITKGPAGILSLCRAALRSDVVLCGGGGLFQDDDSLVKMPYWALRVALMRLFCRRLIGYSLGVGPLRTALSRVFAGLAFSLMEQVTVRDRLAQALSQRLTSKPVRVIPDPALLIKPEAAHDVQAFLALQGVPLHGRPLIGVAPRRWFPPRNRIIPHAIKVKFVHGEHQVPTEEQCMIALLARILDGMVKQFNAHIVFMPTYAEHHEGDVRICKQIQADMGSASSTLLRIQQPALYKGVTGELAVLLGGRMHPTILASAMGTPCVGLSYNQKFTGFFLSLGAADQVMDVESFVSRQRVDDLASMLEKAMVGRVDRSQRIGALIRRLDEFNQRLIESLK